MMKRIGDFIQLDTGELINTKYIQTVETVLQFDSNFHFSFVIKMREGVEYKIVRTNHDKLFNIRKEFTKLLCNPES